jgi:hypothetical protein
MIMRALFALLLLAISVPASAETLGCPDLSTAVQVNACPSDEELQYTFKGYCGDNARMYDKGDQVCTDYALYRLLKNVSLWETKDGRFDGYVSCETGPVPLAQGRAVKLAVSKQGSVTRVACSYDVGVTFTHRTKAKCTAAMANCSSVPGSCKAECE